jgi:acetyl-CoA decarbonylase/synthase complex subunit delta
MPISLPTEKWSGKISELTIGTTASEGGTRGSKITVGGETTLPFLKFDGTNPHKPVILMEVFDAPPEFPKIIENDFQGLLDSPVKWAKTAVENWHADMVCLKLKGANPEAQNRTPEECANTVSEILKAVSVPIFVYGCGVEEKDAKVMQAVGDVVSKERCVIGLAENEKYKSMAAVAMGSDQNLVAFSNLDINLAKQLNILLTDFGVKKERIIMDPLQGGLGYGLDYSYSVVERIRLAALQGDAMLQMPIVCDTTTAWNAREATDTGSGATLEQGVHWEALTGISAITAGADMLIVRHPESARVIRHAIDNLVQKEAV